MPFPVLQIVEFDSLPSPELPRNPKLGPPMRDPDSTIVDRAHNPRDAIR